MGKAILLKGRHTDFLYDFGDGEPVLFLHGYKESSRYFQYQFIVGFSDGANLAMVFATAF